MIHLGTILIIYASGLEAAWPGSGSAYLACWGVLLQIVNDAVEGA